VRRGKVTRGGIAQPKVLTRGKRQCITNNRIPNQQDENNREETEGNANVTGTQ